MPVLIGWCWFAAAVLLVSLVVQGSTFLGIDPMARWPGVMFIHIAIFPPFIAALYYSWRIGGKEQGHQDRVFKSSPRWLGSRSQPQWCWPCAAAAGFPTAPSRAASAA